MVNFNPMTARPFFNRLRSWIKKNYLLVPDIDHSSSENAQNPEILIGDSQYPSFIPKYTIGKYPHKQKRKIFFAVSSGLCNLSCPYCITNRPRLKEHLNKDDFAFIFDYFGENIYFIFSGLGDFFCGYSRKDQLLRFLLQHDVKIFLDINGVEIHELGEPDLENKERITLIDVSYHYGTMKKQNLLDRWVTSVNKIHENRYNYELKMVVSPLESDMCEEAIAFYRNEVLPVTGQKLKMVVDGFVDLESHSAELIKIADIYSDCVEFSGRDAFFREKTVPPAKAIPCAAGSRYFRIFNNGDITPCELLGDRMNLLLGNSKRREMIPFNSELSCHYTGFCDCYYATNIDAGL